ncbi:transcriptional coactivator p15/PC4 family protein [bacterium]|nr:transcriptional coactivator p15/PC4 family protein [bacterium]
MAEEPKILATIPRNATEQVQISINSYKDKKYLDLRIYYTTDDGGTWLPTKKGVTVSPDNLILLKDAVEEAMQELLTVEEE